eukprot:gene12219-biopygen4324
MRRWREGMRGGRDEGGRCDRWRPAMMRHIMAPRDRDEGWRRGMATRDGDEGWQRIRGQRTVRYLCGAIRYNGDEAKGGWHVVNSPLCGPSMAHAGFPRALRRGRRRNECGSRCPARRGARLVARPNPP